MQVPLHFPAVNILRQLPNFYETCKFSFNFLLSWTAWVQLPFGR